MQFRTYVAILQLKNGFWLIFFKYNFVDKLQLNAIVF